MSRFLSDIEAFLQRYALPPTRFGQEAMGDGAFVATMRAGRSPRLDTVERVETWMAAYRADHRPVRAPAQRSARG